MKTGLSAVAILSLAPVAFAQDVGPQRAQFTISLSLDGVNWTRSLSFDPSVPQPVFARLTMDYHANGGIVPMGLNVAKSQPTARGWDPTLGDSLLPYNTTTVIEPDLSLDDGDGYTLGRTFGPRITPAIVSHQYTFQNEKYQRFAEATVTLHPGQGSGNNNVSGRAGINSSGSPIDFRSPLNDLLLFVWGMNFAADRTGTLHFDVPRESFRTSPDGTMRSANFGVAQAPHTFIEAPMLDTLGADIIFVPSPAPLALLGAAALLRRRR